VTTVSPLAQVATVSSHAQYEISLEWSSNCSYSKRGVYEHEGVIYQFLIILHK
jgi:hypothetical protein